MSNTPPPPFGPSGPLSPPPGPAGGPPISPPGWQSGPAAGGLTQPPAPTEKSKKPLVIALAVIAVVIVVIVVVMSGGDDEGGGGSVNAAGAKAGLDAVFEGSEELESLGFESLSRCPMGRVSGLLDTLGERFELSEELTDADDVSLLFDLDGDAVAFCSQAADDSAGTDDGFGGVQFLAISDPPRNFEDFAIETATEDGEDEAEPAGEEGFAGGTIFTFCGDNACSSWWNDTDNEIAIAVGLEAEEVAAKDTVAALKLLLPSMAASLAANADDSDENES